MHSVIAGLPLIFCLYVFDVVAAPIALGFTTRSALPCLQADKTSTTFVSPLFQNITSSHRYPRELSNASNELQPIPNAFFPKYGIVLLILFIIVCALSSVLVIITSHSRSAREWIIKVSRRVYTRITSCQGREVLKDNQSLHRNQSGENRRCDSENCDPTSPYDISPELQNKSSATSSEETVATIPAIPFSVSVHSPSSKTHQRSTPRSAAHSHHDSAHSHPLSPAFSPLLDHLQTLLSTSKRMFQSFTADITSRSSTPQLSSPTIRVTVDVSKPMPPKSDAFVTSYPVTRTNSDGVNVMEVESDLGCQDIASIPASTVNITLMTQQSPLPHNDHSITHSSPSRSGFYSLSGDDQLSASTAFHSFIDLASPSDTYFDAIPASNPSGDVDPVICLLSPRYIHGVQLETIHEESDGQITCHAAAPTASLVRNDSLSKMISTKCFNKSDTSLSSTCQNPPPGAYRKDPETISKSQPDSISFTGNMPSSWAELNHETFPPLRFSPAARPPPPPSEPSSSPTLQVVSALRSPERQDRRRSVAWLQPVIDWAVDHPRDDCECDLEVGGLDGLENIPDMESDAECDAALHSADAMAAVMNSLAAIGLDPTDMGLVRGEAISSRLSNSSLHYTSHSIPFADTEAFRSSLNARGMATGSDLEEEEEVENEIGVFGNNTPPKLHRFGVSSREGQCTSTEVQYNRSLYKSQQQGECIKTALISLLSPSSSHPNPSEMQPEVHGESSDDPISPAQAFPIETPRRESRQEKFPIKCAGTHDMGRDSKISTGGTSGVRSPTSSRPVTRTPRTVQPDRVYASPSSLAGLSPLEVAKKFSASSISSAGSTPSPSGNRAASPLNHPTSVSPSQLCKTKGLSNPPSFDCTVSTLASPPHHDPVSPSPRSRTPVSSRQRWQQGEHSALGSTKSTPMLSMRHNTGFLSQFGSPISGLQRKKPSAVSTLTRSAPILIERTNSMEFDPV